MKQYSDMKIKSNELYLDYSVQKMPNQKTNVITNKSRQSLEK